MKKSVAQRLSEALKVGVKAVRPEGCFGWEWHTEDGRVVRRYAEPYLEYNGCSGSKFATFYSADGWTRIHLTGDNDEAPDR